MVAVSPDRRRAYTANIGSGTVSVLDLADGTQAARHRGRRPARGDRAQPRRAHALGRRPRGRAGAGVRHRELRAAGRGAHRRRADPGRGEPGRALDRHLEPRLRLPHHHRRAHARERPRDRGQRQRRQPARSPSSSRPTAAALYAAETGRNQVAEVELESGRVLRRLPAGAQGDGLAIAPDRMADHH